MGIGTSSPSGKLHVLGGRSTFYSGDNYAIGVGNASGVLGGYMGSPAVNVLSFSEPGGVERMRIESGNLLVGRTASLTGQSESISSDTVMSVHGVLNQHQSACGVMQYTANAFQLRAYGATAGTGNIQFLVGGGGNSADSEAMRIDSAGRLFVGTTSQFASTPAKFSILYDGNNEWGSVYKTTASTGVPLVFLNSGNTAVGNISVTSSATAYNTSSDYRLKENVAAMSGATERLKQLNPSRFNFIADADTTVDGFLAHEVQDVVPEAISGTKDAMMDEEYEVTPAVLDDDGNVTTEAVMGTRSVPDYQGIDQSKLVPLLVATIQELEARLTALENN